MPHIEDILLTAISEEGARYIYGGKGSPLDPHPYGIDCSGLVKWACDRAGLTPTVPDGAFYQWHHVQQLGTVLPVEQALHTRGALLFVGKDSGRYDDIPHVAWSLGDKTTVEARGIAWGVGTWASPGRFQLAGLLPGIDYSPRHPPPLQGVADMVTTCIPSWAQRDGTTEWVGFYRLADDLTSVLAYNGAPLNGQLEAAEFLGVPLAVLPALNAPPIGLGEIESTGAIVVVCADGGVIDVAKRP